MSSKTLQRAAISQFMSITGVNEKIATKLLKANNWQLAVATDRSKAGTRTRATALPPDSERYLYGNTTRVGWGQSIRSKNKSKAFYEAIYGKASPGLGETGLGYGYMSDEYAKKWLDYQDDFYRSPSVITVTELHTTEPSIHAVRHEEHVALSDPQALRKVDQALLGHKLNLLDSLSTRSPSVNILEILSADRLPLPPALARALARSHSPKKPSLGKVRHGLLLPPPPSGFPRPLRPVSDPVENFVAEDEIGKLSTKLSALSLPSREQTRQTQPTAQTSAPRLLPNSFKDLLAPSSSAHYAHMHAVAVPRNMTNMKLNSYFASNGASGAGGQDTDSLSRLFDKYRVSTDEKDMCGVDGTMQYLQDLGVNLENAQLFLACEIIQAPGLGELSRESFIEGWRPTGADTIAKQQAYIASAVKELATNTAVFKRVYKHTFICAKDKGAKALPLDNALIYWGMLFTSPGKPLVTKSCNWLALWQEYLEAKWTKSVNKDMWNQTLEFFLKVLQDEDLTFWSEDGAWPGVIDDFVAYAKVKRGLVADTMETD